MVLTGSGRATPPVHLPDGGFLVPFGAGPQADAVGSNDRRHEQDHRHQGHERGQAG